MNKWDKFIQEAQSIGCKVSIEGTKPPFVFKLQCPNGQTFGKLIDHKYFDATIHLQFLADSGMKTLELIKSGFIWGKSISLIKVSA